MSKDKNLFKGNIMTIRLSEREKPTIEEMRRAYNIISEVPEGDFIKQVIMTNFGGKQTRYLDPETRKVVRMIPRSFNLGPVAGFNGLPFDFSKFEEKAKTMTDKELLY